MSQCASPLSGSGPHISICGAGIIGLSCAWALAKRGAKVTIHDIYKPGRGASWAAAGMLAPAYEAAGEDGAHPHLFDLCLQSAGMWGMWVSELEDASGLSCRYSATGSIAVAVTEDQARHLEALSSTLAERGVAREELSPEQAREREPTLSGNILSALRLPTDGQVDNRCVVEALIKVVTELGLFVPQPPLHPDITVNAQGWQTFGVQPVGGQMCSIASQAGHPRHVIRAGSTYIVPRSDRTIIGATVETGHVANHASEEALTDLVRDAAMICPVLASGKRLDCWAGTRPMTADHAPIIGWGVPGGYYASGHYRNGILLAPLTGEIVADHILENSRTVLAEQFDPSRFDTDKV